MSTGCHKGDLQIDPFVASLPPEALPRLQKHEGWAGGWPARHQRGNKQGEWTNEWGGRPARTLHPGVQRCRTHRATVEALALLRALANVTMWPRHLPSLSAAGGSMPTATEGCRRTAASHPALLYAFVYGSQAVQRAPAVRRGDPPAPLAKPCPSRLVCHFTVAGNRARALLATPQALRQATASHRKSRLPGARLLGPAPPPIGSDRLLKVIGVSAGMLAGLAARGGRAKATACARPPTACRAQCCKLGADASPPTARLWKTLSSVALLVSLVADLQRHAPASLPPRRCSSRPPAAAFLSTLGGWLLVAGSGGKAVQPGLN